MSKKLTKSELEFLVGLITNKIVEKKQQERNQAKRHTDRKNDNIQK